MDQLTGFFNNKKLLIYRVIATLLSLAFFHFFPVVVSASYMAWNGFFSYDFFSDGDSGIQAFYLYTELIIIVFSLYTTGVATFFIARKKLYPGGLWKQAKLELIFTILLNFFILLITFLFIYLSNKVEFSWYHWVGLLIVSIWISCHIGLVISGNGLHIFRSLVGGILLLMFIAAFSPGVFALPYSFALQLYGNGGGIPVNIVTDDKKIDGQLILASPKNLYVNSNNKMIIISREEAKEILIRNLSGFGHQKSRENNRHVTSKP